jgi:hypothetical protein
MHYSVDELPRKSFIIEVIPSNTHCHFTFNDALQERKSHPKGFENDPETSADLEDFEVIEQLKSEYDFEQSLVRPQHIVDSLTTSHYDVVGVVM